MQSELSLQKEKNKYLELKLSTSNERFRCAEKVIEKQEDIMDKRLARMDNFMDTISWLQKSVYGPCTQKYKSCCRNGCNGVARCLYCGELCKRHQVWCHNCKGKMDYCYHHSHDDEDAYALREALTRLRDVLPVQESTTCTIHTY